MHKGSVNRVTVAASSRLPLSSTRRCLPFRSRAVAVEIIAFVVLCNAIVSRIEGFLWAAAGKGRRLLVLCGLRTLDVHEVYLNARSGTHSSGAFSSRAETVARKYRARAPLWKFSSVFNYFRTWNIPRTRISPSSHPGEKWLGEKLDANEIRWIRWVPFSPLALGRDN